MLKLRQGVVVDEDPLTVEVDGRRRPAWADRRLLGEMMRGDQVVVNVEALDLDLGSGGFDVVYLNLTRGLRDGGARGPHVMKLNYTPIQHPAELVERRPDELGSERRMPIPVLVIPMHGHLAPAAWAAAQAVPGLRVGYVQTAGGALPGPISRDVSQLRSLGLLCGHVTAAPAYGGEQEALSVCGALDAASHRLRWDAAIAGPGPGIIGSDTHFGHGGMVALDNAHAALSLGMPTLLSPRLSAADQRPRHRGLSHHTKTVLGLLLAAVDVPAPADEAEAIAALDQAADGRHRVLAREAPVERYATSGLPTRTMGRELSEDRMFFAAALASGAALAGAAHGGRDR